MLIEKVDNIHLVVIVDLVLKAARVKKRVHYKTHQIFVVVLTSKVGEKNLIIKDFSMKINIVFVRISRSIFVFLRLLL